MPPPCTRDDQPKAQRVPSLHTARSLIVLRRIAECSVDLRQMCGAKARGQMPMGGQMPTAGHRGNAHAEERSIRPDMAKPGACVGVGAEDVLMPSTASTGVLSLLGDARRRRWAAYSSRGQHSLWSDHHDPRPPLKRLQCSVKPRARRHGAARS